MKCKKCGNEYDSNYYFSAPEVCNDCFKQLSAEEQQELLNDANRIHFGAYTIDDYRTAFGRRFGAALLDFLFYFLLLMVVAIGTGFIAEYGEMITQVQALGQMSAAAQEYAMSFMKDHMVTYIIFDVIILAYFLLEIMIATSLGKMLLGIQIASYNGSKPTTVQLLTRYLIKNIGVIFSFFAFLLFGTAVSDIFSTAGTVLSIIMIIGFFFILARRRQGFHDRLSGTAVFPRRLLAELEENSQLEK